MAEETQAGLQKRGSKASFPGMAILADTLAVEMSTSLPLGVPDCKTPV